MEVKGDEPKRTGVLMRAANGDLWVLLEGDNEPRKLEDEELVKRLNPLLPTAKEQQAFTFPVPQRVIDMLEETNPDFGPLWWCWVFFSAARLR